MDKGTDSGGTLVRGADGALYFISNDKLEAFRLSGKRAEQARDLLKDQGDLLTLSVLSGPNVKRAGLAMEDASIISVVNVVAPRR